MGKYLEQNLSRNEKIVKQAKLSAVSIFTGGILRMPPRNLPSPTKT